MIYYETLMLLKPDISNGEFNDLKLKLEEIIEKDFSAKIRSFDKWGKYLLSYPIRKCNYGIYLLTRFELETEDKKNNLIAKLKSFFILKVENLVMRYVIYNLGNKLNETYSRPDSLEEAPRRDNNKYDYKSKNQRNYNKENNISEVLSESEKDLDLEVIEDITVPN